jgi:hypothetical protein
MPRNYKEENRGDAVSRALQGNSRRERYRSVVGYSPDSNDVSTDAEESPLLRAVARERMFKTQQAGKRLSACCGDL